MSLCRNCRIFPLCRAANSAEHHTAGIIIAPSLRYMEEAYFDARRFGWSKKPIVEMLIPSTLDDTLAPRGAHVASLFCQHVAPILPDGKSWDDHREEVADLMIETVDRLCAEFQGVGHRAANLFAARSRTHVRPRRRRYLSRGARSRPIVLRAADARPCRLSRPDPGPLYVRRGTHPGGGVTGLPGHNAAREILRDAKRF